jgi:hypothetical protein
METSPLEWILIFLAFVVPVLGLTARLALKPIVDAILRLQQGFSQAIDTPQIQRRMHQMEQDITALQAEVDRLTEVSSFHESVLVSRTGEQTRQVATTNEAVRLERPADR